MESHGIDTGALVIFINILARHIRNEQPDSMLMAWDGGYSAFRLKMYPEYKASRKVRISDEPQAPFAIVKYFLKLLGIPQLELPGYEGDDIIAATWAAIRHKSKIVILSSDKDLMQLVDNTTEQIKFTPSSLPVDRWDRTRVITDMGYPPTCISSVMALTGDKSDDVPGLPGVGPKTAVKMLKKYDWQLDALIESLPAEDQMRVLTNYTIIDLTDIPLELDPPPLLHITKPGDPEWDKLEAFCDRFELKNILDKLRKDTLW